MKYEHIIWDWNGTLLNDTHVTIACMNSILRDRGLEEMDRERYLANFGFPVSDYYKKIGLKFEKESFEEVSCTFIANYESMVHESVLHNSVKETLNEIKELGLSQSILSASEQRVLREYVADFEIDGFFTEMIGLDNHHAKSKVERGLEWIKDQQIDINKTVMVGDTLHDVKVAKALGCDCVLVSHGHQSYERLSTADVKVFDNLGQFVEYIKE